MQRHVEIQMVMRPAVRDQPDQQWYYPAQGNKKKVPSAGQSLSRDKSKANTRETMVRVAQKWAYLMGNNFASSNNGRRGTWKRPARFDFLISRNLIYDDATAPFRFANEFNFVYTVFPLWARMKHWYPAASASEWPDNEPEEVCLDRLDLQIVSAKIVRQSQSLGWSSRFPVSHEYVPANIWLEYRKQFWFSCYQLSMWYVFVEKKKRNAKLLLTIEAVEAKVWSVWCFRDGGCNPRSHNWKLADERRPCWGRGAFFKFSPPSEYYFFLHRSGIQTTRAVQIELPSLCELVLNFCNKKQTK